MPEHRWEGATDSGGFVKQLWLLVDLMAALFFSR
jgi:hypothetical protein